MFEFGSSAVELEMRLVMVWLGYVASGRFVGLRWVGVLTVAFSPTVVAGGVINSGGLPSFWCGVELMHYPLVVRVALVAALRAVLILR